jgi:hypothetical protein
MIGGEGGSPSAVLETTMAESFVYLLWQPDADGRFNFVKPWFVHDAMACLPVALRTDDCASVGSGRSVCEEISSKAPRLS